MPTWVLVYGPLALALLIVGIALLKAIDSFIDAARKERIRIWFESLWFEIADAEAHVAFRVSVNKLYLITRHLRRAFIKLYWVFLIIVFLSTVPFELVGVPDQFAAPFRAEINNNLDVNFRSAFYLGMISHQQYFETLERWCAKNNKVVLLYKQPEDIIRIEKDISDVIVRQRADVLNLFIIACYVVTIFILGLCFSLSLLASFKITLFLLSRVVGSNLQMVFIIGGTLLLSVIMPFVFAHLSLLLIFGIMAPVFGFVNFSSFDNPNLMTIGTSYVLVALEYFSPIYIVVAILSKFTLAISGLLGLASAILKTTIDSTESRIVTFFYEARHAAAMKFSSVPYTDAVINWAIITDFFYSMTFIIPAVSLVAVRKNKFLREVSLNIIQRIAEHRRGPLAAIGEGLEYVITSLKSSFK